MLEGRKQMKMSSEQTEMLKKGLCRRLWEEQLVDVVADFIAFRIVSIQEAENLGIPQEEIEDVFDDACLKLKNVIDEAILAEDELTIKNLENLRKSILLEDAQINILGL